MYIIYRLAYDLQVTLVHFPKKFVTSLSRIYCGLGIVYVLALLMYTLSHDGYVCT